MPYRAEFAAYGYYHVFNRGNNRQPIFFEREHFAFFLRTMRDCTFSQHMQSLSLRYTKSINESRDRVGSLFQGRFKSVLVDRDEYLLHLSRYIHLNPVDDLSRAIRRRTKR